MASDQERAKFYLTRWKELMASENPLREILWFAGGSIENESMVVHHLRVLQDSLRAELPDIHHKIFTNCKDIDGWQDSYVFKFSGLPVDSGHTYQKGVHAAVVGYLEEGFSTDVYMTNGFPPAFALYGLGLIYFNKPLPPVIPVMAKVPEGLWDYVTEDASIRILRSMALEETFWIYVLDSENEHDLMLKLLEKAGIFDFERIRKVRTFQWDGAPFPLDEKKDLVVWSGRANTMKNPDLAIKVFSMLHKVEKEVFFPRPSAGWAKRFEALDHCEVHQGEPPEIYRQLTRSAKVMLITSHAEGFPAGFIELWVQGVVPVVWDRPWNTCLLPKDWPFRFKQPGEAVEMILEVLENYETYAKMLYEWSLERFTKPLNLPELLSESWGEYTLALGDSIRLASSCGERRSL